MTNESAADPIARLRELIQKWRALADDFGAAKPSVAAATACGWINKCATDLEELAAALPVVPSALQFTFTCRECDGAETPHRFVAAGSDRIIVQCLACLETCCVYERPVVPSEPPDLNEDEMKFLLDHTREVLQREHHHGETVATCDAPACRRFRNIQAKVLRAGRVLPAAPKEKADGSR